MEIIKKLKIALLVIFQIFRVKNNNRRGPELVDIAITSACNHKCYFCEEHSYFKEKTTKKPSTLSDDVIDKLFLDLIKLKVERITLAGNGEQLLMPKTLDVINKYGKRFKFQVATNGTSLKKIDKKLYEKISKITVSINSINPLTHKLIHGYVDGKETSQLPSILLELNRILEFKGSDSKVLISYAMSKDNLNELDTLFEFVEKHNCEFSIRPVHLIFDEMHQRGVGLTRGDRQIIVQKITEYLTQKRSQRVKKIWSSTLSKFTEYNEMIKPVEHQELKPCYSGFRVINIWSDGQVHQCTYSDHSLGNIYENRFSDIWDSVEFKQKLSQAATMNVTGKPPYKHCPNCLEIQGNSAALHQVVKFIPRAKDNMLEIVKN